MKTGWPTGWSFTNSTALILTVIAASGLFKRVLE
jgi:hypothetical protein